uniref:Uncharacterized protein n=1 Tax=Vespula pensylvanica TaxID=30213 RepID=A0A834NQD2_VESPE|nr:hypothetical protein H0235_012116 [Vespula pensylvanica]
MRLGVGEKGGKWELVVGGWVGEKAKEPSVGCNLSCRIRFKIIDPPGGWRIASHYFWTDGNPHREAGLRKIKTRRSLAPDEKFDGEQTSGLSSNRRTQKLRIIVGRSVFMFSDGSRAS